jgi:predicted RNA-binding protein with PUA-like domain
MNAWLVKSEPTKWSWDDQVRAGTTHWDGVRNAQATINLKAMRVGDRAFFYHSNEGKEIVGVVEIVREFYLDPRDETGKFGMVDVKAVKKLPRPVTLAEIKGDPALQTMALVRQSRLSVMPVTPEEWSRIVERAGLPGA